MEKPQNESGNLFFDKNGDGYIEHLSTSETLDLMYSPVGLSKDDYLNGVDIEKLKSNSIQNDEIIKNIIQDKDNSQNYICNKYNITKGQLDVLIGKLYNQYENLPIPDGYKKIKQTQYCVNRNGDVINYRKRKSLNQTLNANGYPCVSINFRKDICLPTETHRLVALYFIPNPELKPQVNHIDGNPLNNNISNLEWVTAQENVKHAYDTGLNKHINGKHKDTKLSVKDVNRILELKDTCTRKELAAMFNVSTSHVCKIISGKKRRRINQK